MKSEIEYIELKNLMYAIFNQNIIDFNNEYSVEDISMKHQNEINKIILDLRQKYYINKYKKALEYMELFVPFMRKDYDIAQVYGLNFDQIPFNTLRRFEFSEFVYKYNPDDNRSFLGENAFLFTKKERLDMKLNKGIMNYIGPKGYCSYTCRDGRRVYPLFKKRDFIENVTNLHNELNFIKLINIKNDNVFAIYPASKFNIPEYFDLVKTIYQSKNIENELSFYNTDDKYTKTFEYNIKTEKVLYITNKFSNDIDKIEFGYVLDDYELQDFEDELNSNLKIMKELEKRNKEKSKKE